MCLQLFYFICALNVFYLLLCFNKTFTQTICYTLVFRKLNNDSACSNATLAYKQVNVCVSSSVWFNLIAGVVHEGGQWRMSVPTSAYISRTTQKWRTLSEAVNHVLVYTSKVL